MAIITTYLANKLLDHALGKTAYTMPTVYAGLSSSTPVIAGTGVTEPTAGTGAYARVNSDSPLVWGAAALNGAQSTSTNSAAALTFPTSTAAWSTGASNLTYIVFYDASTAGNLLWFEPITTPFAVNATGVTPSAATSQITFNLA